MDESSDEDPCENSDESLLTSDNLGDVNYLNILDSAIKSEQEIIIKEELDWVNKYQVNDASSPQLKGSHSRVKIFKPCESVSVKIEDEASDTSEDDENISVKREKLDFLTRDHSRLQAENIEETSQSSESFRCMQETSVCSLLSSSASGNKKKFLKSACETPRSHSTDKLKTLVRQHSNAELFKCPECNFKTNNNKCLKSHLLIHLNSKLFKCSQCDYETNYKSKLKTHLLTHSELLKCSECDYQTKSKAIFKAHFLNHLGIKLFQCPECDYESNYKGSLKSHLLKHSGTKLFKCSECDYETNYKGSFSIHLLKHSGTK